MTLTSAIDLFAALERAAERFPDRRALVPPVRSGRGPSSYRMLLERVREAGAALRAVGVQDGERVGILAREGDRLVLALLAVQAAGGVAVLLDPTLGPDERAAQLSAGRPTRLVIAGDAEPVHGVPCHDLASLRSRREVEPRAVQRAALVAFTSGTAGHPHAVVLSSAGLAHQLAVLPAAIGARDGETVFLSLLGPQHLFELVCGLLTPLTTGATIVFAESTLPHEVAAQAAREGVTHSCLVPALARLLAGAVGHSSPNVTPWTWFCGGAALDPALEGELERHGQPCLVGYGLSEFSPVVSTNRPDARRAGSVGRPLEGVDVRLADGELEVRGESAMLGYLGEPEATRAAFTDDGWLRTGDLASLDADGYLHVEGRSGDLVVLDNGKKVHPDEVEPYLRLSEAFRDACALRLPGGRGAELAAVVVPAVPLSPRGAEREVARLTAHLAPWKRPTRVVVREAPLPRTATWKVRRRTLALEIA